MAEGQFSPDLLLTVGADISALRQQLATIQRDLGIAPIQVRVEAQAQEVQQVARSFNEASAAANNATASTARLYTQLRQVTVAKAELDKVRYIINPEAFANNQAGLERITTALRVVYDTFGKVNAGVAIGRTEWAQYGAQLAIVQTETARLMASEKGLVDLTLQQAGALSVVSERERARAQAAATTAAEERRFFLERQSQLRSLLVQYEAITRAQQRAARQAQEA